MNVTIIYGNMDDNNLYNCAELFLKKLESDIDSNLSVSKFFLSNKLFSSYSEHLPCFINNKYMSLNFNNIHPIINTLNESDLIILVSSVYACDISPQMKLFLDNLSDILNIDNTNSTLSNKIGVVMCTTAGAGLSNSVRTLKNYLNLWGIKQTFRFSCTLYELNWLDVSLKTKEKISQHLSILAKKVSKHPRNVSSKVSSLFNLPSFLNTRKIQSKKYLNVTDFPTQKRTKYY